MVGGKTISHPPLHTEPTQVDKVNCDHQEQAVVAEQQQQIEENDLSTHHEKAQPFGTHTVCCAVDFSISLLLVNSLAIKNNKGWNCLS